VVPALSCALVALLALPASALADFTYEFKWGAGAGSGASGDGNGEFSLPTDVVYSNGEVYVTDLGNNRIQRFTDDAHFIDKWGANGGDGSSGNGDGEFTSPFGITADASGDVYVADADNNRVQKLGPTGTFIARWGANGGDGSPGTGEGEFS
jgi:DNA-binding beta-propeller fold protein YncE